MTAQAKKPQSEGQLNLTRTIHEVSLMISRIFNRRVKDVGLTRVQWQTLYLLYSRDGLTQTELADGLAMAKPPLGKVVDRLEEEGWVERRDDPTDRRAKRVFLTEKVAPLIPQLKLLVDEIGSIAMNGISQADRIALISLLEAVHTNLTAAAEPNSDGG